MEYLSTRSGITIQDLIKVLVVNTVTSFLKNSPTMKTMLPLSQKKKKKNLSYKTHFMLICKMDLASRCMLL